MGLAWDILEFYVAGAEETKEFLKMRVFNNINRLGGEWNYVSFRFKSK
jgi:hypothetical protein